MFSRSHWRITSRYASDMWIVKWSLFQTLDKRLHCFVVPFTLINYALRECCVDIVCIVSYNQKYNNLKEKKTEKKNWNRVNIVFRNKNKKNDIYFVVVVAVVKVFAKCGTNSFPF